MNNNSFSRTMIFDQSPEEVFNAVNNVRGWWSESVEGSTHRQGDEFIYKHKDIHDSTQKLTEVIPNKRVVWLVTKSKLTFVEKQDEWTGTEVIFDIAEKDGKTQLTFTHEGLIPDFQCYNGCSDGWSWYLGSLNKLITTGQGEPDKK